MECESCGTTCAPASKFCHECGSPLARRCPSCGAGVEAAQKFCHECGAGLAAGAGAREDGEPGGAGEVERRSVADRRFVSVLFADLVDYTALAEGRDSDDVRDLLTEYFDRARGVIEKYGGLVEKFIGDAIFGVWGTEVVREDDAERAVRAGLELVGAVEALGPERGLEGLRVRVGIMSGATTVGPGGNQGTGMIVGDLVNTAARLQSVADPGTVLVGRATHEVTARSITYESRGELDVKGKSEAVEAWRAIRPGGRLGSEPHQRTLPFVGRDREMHVLTDWLDATAAEERARLVAITGEAGIGKSRLVAEFMNQVDGYAEDVYWHQGRSPSYGEGVPMWSLIEMIRQRAGIREDEAPGRASTRLRTMLAEYVEDLDDRRWIESWFTGLLGLAEMPAGSRSELLSAVRAFFQHVAARGPTVLVFEDLHWADPAVIEFIDELVGRSTRAPILVIALARPELFERHARFGSHLRSSVNVALAGLADDDMRAAVAEFLGRPLPELADRIVGRAAGYPLYAVEMLRMLQNTGDLVEVDGGFEWHGDLDHVAIPDTLQAVIGARLDRLDHDVRDVLQDAAVLGLSFHAEAAAAIGGRSPAATEDALSALVRLDLLEVVDDRRSPERGQYRFVQGLIQEVAYRRLNRAERRARHLAAAEWIGRDDDPELAGVVAQHFIGAYDSSPEGPARDELVQRAVASLVGAAARSAALHADAVAMELWDRAIALGPDDREVIRWQLAAARSALADGIKERALSYVEDADRRAVALGDHDLATRVAVARAQTLNSFFDAAAAVRVIEPVYVSLDRLDGDLAIEVAAETVRSYALVGDTDQAVAAADRVLPIVERAGDARTAIEVLISRGTALEFGERGIEGLATLIGAFELAEREGLSDQALRAANNITALLAEVDVGASALWADRMRALAERTGVREAVLRCDHQAAECAMRAGELEEACSILDQIRESELDATWVRFVELLDAAIALRRGDDGAIEAHEAILATFVDTGDPQLSGVLDGAAAQRHEFAREWELAGAVARRGGVWARHSLVIIAHAHARSGLPHPLRPDVSEIVQASPRGPVRAGSEALIDALDAARAGDVGAAAGHGRSAVDALDAGGDAEAAMRARATLILALGRDHPLSERFAETLAAWIDRHDLHGWRRVYADVLPTGDARAAG